MSGSANPTRVALVPRDGFFCKDGRGWHTSSSGRGHGLDWPWPSTILGALRTAWGREAEQAHQGPFDWRTETAGVTLGRSLVLRRPMRAGAAQPFSTDARVWPVPADALWLEGHERVYALRPKPPAISTLGGDVGNPDIKVAREALWVPEVSDSSKPKSPPRWWSEECFTNWLCGDVVPAKPEHGHLKAERRMQAHVGIRPDRLTADDGILFAHDVVETLEPKAEWAIGVEVTLPRGKLPPFATLGGDGRLAHIEDIESNIFEPPPHLIEKFSGSGQRFIRLVVVTPACFTEGWLPDGFTVQGTEFRGTIAEAKVVLRAAFVGRPVHISGWDMATNKPKLTSRMVPPGAVYFCERTDGKTFGEKEARALWLAAIGSRPRTAEGFGRVVPGIWNPSGS